MDQTFRNAGAINADLGGWSLSKVTTIFSMFDKAVSFTGVGVDKWTTGAVTDMSYTFEGATKMNADVSTWNVDKVNGMTNVFKGTLDLSSCNKYKIRVAWATNAAFVAAISGTDCDTDYSCEPWCIGAPLTDAMFKTATCKLYTAPTHPNPTSPPPNTPSHDTCTNALSHMRSHSLAPLVRRTTPSVLASLAGDWVQSPDSATTKWGDIGDWVVSGVKDYKFAFAANRCKPPLMAVCGNPKMAAFSSLAGLSKWTTTSVTDLGSTFKGAGGWNADLSLWDVRKVTDMGSTFFDSAKYRGDGLEKWDVSSVNSMGHVFYGTALLKKSCNKKKILDAWMEFPITAFVNTDYDTDWASDSCLVCGNGKYKRTIPAINSPSGYTPATTTCIACPSGSYSARNDQSLCTACGADNKWSASGATVCAVCPSSSFTSGGSRSGQASCSPCVAGRSCDGTSSVNVCAKGKFSAAGVAMCTICKQGKYTNVAGQTACQEHTTKKCGTGQGFLAGSTWADDASCIPCSSETWSICTVAVPCSGQQACKPWTVSTCSAGKGYHAGSASADATCPACALGKYSASSDKAPCTPHSTPTCNTGTPIIDGTAIADGRCIVLERETEQRDLPFTL